jgi:tetratricopeptide (TPR) repeat protein
MEEAHRVDPNLPEVTLAEAHLLPLWAYGQALDLLAQAKARAPDKSLVYADEATALLRVGRMADAIASARRAAELDPLSPAAETQLIMTFAYGGQIEDARHELQRAEKLWAGTGALRDAEFAFHLRYGDPKIAAQLTTMSDLKPYLAAREDPSPANIEALLNQLRRFETRPNPGDVGFAVQALADFHRPDDVFRWLGLIPAESEAEGADILFRPAFAEVRRDPRFLAAAKRLRLVDYWEKTGNWPDFCSDRTLPYDCKKEAAKLSA